MISRTINRFKKHSFLFTELVKRDFKEKYKRSILGMGWSLLFPLLELLVMWLVFSGLLGRNVEHYIIYLFSGNLVFNFFSESTNGGMTALKGNAGIFTKVPVPKYLFVLSRNVSAVINFFLTFIMFCVFVAYDGIPFTWHFLGLIYPIGCLMVFNFGVGMLLSAAFIIFKDISYLYRILLKLLMYVSAIFYSVESFPEATQRMFLLNPLFVYIKYFRLLVIDGVFPTTQYHILCFLYAAVAFLAGAIIYKLYNNKFLYYV